MWVNRKEKVMKNSSLIITGLIVFMCFLVFQIFELKQEVGTLDNSGSNQSNVVVPGNFSIYDVTTGNSNQDGYWLYKDDEKILYFFKYDDESKQIIQIQKNIYD